MEPERYEPHPAVHRESLWWLTVSPGIWVLHFIVTYTTVGLWCARFANRHDFDLAPSVGSGDFPSVEASLGSASSAVIVITLVALIGIALNGLRSFRRHRLDEPSDLPHDFDTRESRTRFLGFASFLLSLLSAVGVIYVALPILFFGTCR